jgi:hypothetical protein
MSLQISKVLWCIKVILTNGNKLIEQVKISENIFFSAHFSKETLNKINHFVHMRLVITSGCRSNSQFFNWMAFATKLAIPAAMWFLANNCTPISEEHILMREQANSLLRTVGMGSISGE